MIVIALVIYSVYIQNHFRITHYIKLAVRKASKKKEGVHSRMCDSLGVEDASEELG